MPTSPQKRAAQRHEQVKRRREVARLKLKGLPQYRIAEELGVSTATVSTDVKALEAMWKAESLKDVSTAKAMDLQRLEELIEPLYGPALRGKYLYTDRVLNLLIHRAKLLGLEAPKQAEVSNNVVVRQYVGIDPDNFDREALDPLPAEPTMESDDDDYAPDGTNFDI